MLVKTLVKSKYRLNYFYVILDKLLAFDQVTSLKSFNSYPLLLRQKEKKKVLTNPVNKALGSLLIYHTNLYPHLINIVLPDRTKLHKNRDFVYGR